MYSLLVMTNMHPSQPYCRAWHALSCPGMVWAQHRLARATLYTGGLHCCLALNPAGKHLYVGMLDGLVKVYWLQVR